MNTFTELLVFIKETIADEGRMNKFREIVADIKELIADIRDIKELFKKTDKE